MKQLICWPDLLSSVGFEGRGHDCMAFTVLLIIENCTTHWAYTLISNPKLKAENTVNESPTLALWKRMVLCSFE